MVAIRLHPHLLGSDVCLTAVVRDVDEWPSVESHSRPVRYSAPHDTQLPALCRTKLFLLQVW